MDVTSVSRAPLLSEGDVVEVAVVSSDVHSFGFSLSSGDFLSGVVEQQGADVSLRVLGVDGGVLSEVDSPNGVRGPERFVALAASSGEYRLEVKPSGTTGSYRIRLGSLRPATDLDRRAAAAAARYDSAERMRRLGEAPTAELLAVYAEAEALFRAAGDRAGQGLAVQRRGRVLNGDGRAQAAVEEFHRAAEIYESADLSVERGLVLSRLARTHRHLGALGKATVRYREAIELFGDGEERRRAGTLHNLGLVLEERGESHQALSSYLAALRLWRAMNLPQEEATTLNRVGQAYVLLGQLGLARDELQRALVLRDRVGDRAGEAATRLNLGALYRRTGELELAKAECEQALLIYSDLGQARGRVNALLGLGAAFFQAGDWDAAEPRYNQALEVASSREYRQGRAYALAHLGWLEEVRGAIDAADRHYSDSQRLMAELQDRQGQASTLFGRAKVERARGRFDLALAFVESALELIESLRSDAPNPLLRSSFLASKYDYYEFAVDMLMTLHQERPDAGFDRLGLLAAERSRARSLVDLLAAARGRELDPEIPAFERREHEVLSQLHQIEAAGIGAAVGQETGSGDSEPDRRLLLLQLEHLRSARRHGGRFATGTSGEAVDLEAIQRLLATGDRIFELALGEQRSWAWLLGPESLESIELPSRSELAPLVARARRLLERRHLGNLASQQRQLLDALADKLFGSFRDLDRATRIIVVGDGELSTFPFGALPGPNGRPMLTEREVTYLPSAATMLRLRASSQSRVSRSPSLMIMGDPVFDRDDPRLEGSARRGKLTKPYLGRLRYSRQEVDEILRAIGSTERQVAMAFDANLELFWNGELGRRSHLHLATHGQLGAGGASAPHLTLSRYDALGRPRQGSLLASHLYELVLPVELVVLSACETALGPWQPGEGVLGLAHGFLSAGAQRVVVSLWRVDDEATALLMGSFYRAMFQDGRSPSDALHFAQRQLADSSLWKSPYYWAGFVLQGEWL